MSVEHLLDVAGVDVVAAGEDHLLLAVHDEEVAILVHLGDVAGEEPAIGLQDHLRLLGHVPVALHHLRPLDHQLANLAHRQLLLPRLHVHDLGVGVGEGKADAGLALPVDGVAMGHRRCLGEAVALHQLPAGDLLEPGPDLVGQGHGSGDAGLDGANVILAHLRVGVDGHVHRRHAGEEGGLVLVDRLKHLPHLELGQEHHLRAEVDSHVHAHGHAVDVEEGNNCEDRLPSLLQPDHPISDLDGVHQHIPVGEHGPLGHPRRAAGVLKESQILRLHLHRRRFGGVLGQKVLEESCARLLDDVGAMPILLLLEEGEEELGEGWEVLLDVGDDEVADLRLILDLPHHGVESGQGDDGLGTGVVELMLDLPSDVEGVGGDDDSPRLERTIVGDDELGAVGEVDGDPIPLLHPQASQGGSEPVGQLVQLAIGELRAHEDGGCVVGVLPCRLLQGPMQRLPRVLDRARDPGLVMLEPDLLHDFCHLLVKVKKGEFPDSSLFLTSFLICSSDHPPSRYHSSGLLSSPPKRRHAPGILSKSRERTNPAPVE